MVCDHYQDTRRLESVTNGDEGALELTDFIIDGDANGLKDSSEVRWTGARAEHLTNRTYEIVACGKQPIRPSPDDARGKTPCARFVCVFPQAGFEVVLRTEIQPVRARRPMRAHAHIEPGALAKGEATRPVVDLMRGNAEVEEGAVKVLDCERTIEGVGERGVNNPEVTGFDVRGEALSGLGSGGRVAVDGGYAGAVL